MRNTISLSMPFENKSKRCTYVYVFDTFQIHIKDTNAHTKAIRLIYAKDLPEGVRRKFLLSVQYFLGGDPA